MQLFNIIFGLICLLLPFISFISLLCDNESFARTMSAVSTLILFFVGLGFFGAGIDNEPYLSDVLEGKAKIVTYIDKTINVETNDTIENTRKEAVWIEPKYEE